MHISVRAKAKGLVALAPETCSNDLSGRTATGAGGLYDLSTNRIVLDVCGGCYLCYFMQEIQYNGGISTMCRVSSH